MEILRFDKFMINEKVGVAESTLIYSGFILDKTKFYFDKFLKSGDQEMVQNKSYNLSQRKDIILNKLWVGYPVLNMNITYDFRKESDDVFNKKYPVTSKLKGFTTLGACYNIVENRSRDKSYLLPPIDKRTKHTILLKLEIGVVIRNSFEEREDFLLEVESAIIHELNHAYEGYMRLMSGRGSISVDLTHATDVNRSKIKKEIWKVWMDKIGYYLYASEKHELNAMSQEAFPYVKRYDPTEMRKKSPSWRTAKEMSEFNAGEFKKEIIEKINHYYPGMDPYPILKRLKSGLANELGINREDSIKGVEDAPSLSAQKIHNMSVDKFLSYVQKRVNRAGNNLKKRIYRLYSIKDK